MLDERSELPPGQIILRRDFLKGSIAIGAGVAAEMLLPGVVKAGGGGETEKKEPTKAKAVLDYLKKIDEEIKNGEAQHWGIKDLPSVDFQLVGPAEIREMVVGNWPLAIAEMVDKSFDKRIGWSKEEFEEIWQAVRSLPEAVIAVVGGRLVVFSEDREGRTIARIPNKNKEGRCGLTPADGEEISKELYQQMKERLVKQLLTENHYPESRELTRDLVEQREQVVTWREDDEASGKYDPADGVYPFDYLLKLEERQKEVVENPKLAMIDPTVEELLSLAREMEDVSYGEIPTDVWMTLIFRESGGAGEYARELRDQIDPPNGDGVTGANPNVFSDRRYLSSVDTSSGGLIYPYNGHLLELKARGYGLRHDAKQSVLMAAAIYTDILRQVRKMMTNGDETEDWQIGAILGQSDNLGRPVVIENVAASYPLNERQKFNFRSMIKGMRDCGLSDYAIAYTVYFRGAINIQMGLTALMPIPGIDYSEKMAKYYGGDTVADPRDILGLTEKIGYLMEAAVRFQSTLDRKDLPPWENPNFVGERGGPPGFNFLSHTKIETDSSVGGVK